MKILTPKRKSNKISVVVCSKSQTKNLDWMLIKMENSTAVSGRRRGTTKHSVEDQALDQIAKEVANLRAEKQSSEEESDVEGDGISEKKRERNKHAKEKEKTLEFSNENSKADRSGSSDDSSLQQFYDDISSRESDDEETKYEKLMKEALKEVERDKSVLAEGLLDKGDNKVSPLEVVFKEKGGKFREFESAKISKEFENDSSNRRSVLGTESDSQESLPRRNEVDLAHLLAKENCKAEARLAARRQARAEAREIRLRELERQQKESEENADKVFDMSENILRAGRVAPLSGLMNTKDRPATTPNSYHSSRRSSEDSLEDGSYSLRDIKHELKELDEKFRKAMIANAQLDNEKSELTYQVELLKDRLEDLEESHAQLSRESRDKNREHEQLKRVAVKLKEELSFYKNQLEERDKLITDYGLVIVGGETEEGVTSERVLVSKETAELLERVGDGSLDVRLKKLTDERNELLDEVRHLKLELEEERSKKRADGRSGHGSLMNGPLDEETSKLLSDYRFKLQKAEQDVSTLQANVARLESQVIRYKSAAESSEKAEDELKIEKRKLQRENRESIARIEELETANSHLMRRMDKLKNAKSALLKEL